MRRSDDIIFGTFDPSADVDRCFRDLPHWFQPGVAIFVTFRTADSMPRTVLECRQRELQDWLLRHGLDASILLNKTKLSRLAPQIQKTIRRLRDRQWHRSLDDCHGACVLRQPELAQIVGRGLRYFDGQRYDLDSFVVMPNHVHLLVQFRLPHTLKAQTDSWLRYTGRMINNRLDLRGAFWQSEPFDHLVRNSEQFTYLQDYIANNPHQAHLRPGEYLYWTRVWHDSPNRDVKSSRVDR